MMHARGLPVELLDDEEFKHRFKQIDAAIERVRKEIANAVAASEAAKVKVKLHDKPEIAAH